MLRTATCLNSTFVAFDDLINFRNLPSSSSYKTECNLTQTDMNIFLGVSLTIILFRTFLCVNRWLRWHRNERKQSKYQLITPVLSTIGLFLMILFVLLGYFGLIQASNGSSNLLTHLLFRPYQLLGFLFLKKLLGLKATLTTGKRERFLYGENSFMHFLFLLSFLLCIVETILVIYSVVHSSSFLLLNDNEVNLLLPFFYQYQNCMFVYWSLFFGILLIRTMSQVRFGILKRSSEKRAILAANAVRYQQAFIIFYIIFTSIFFLLLSFVFEPVWEFSFGLMIIEVLGIFSFSVGGTKSKRNHKDAQMLNPIAPPETMFVSSHIINGNEEDLQTHLKIRTLKIPSQDTLLGRYILKRETTSNENKILLIFSMLSWTIGIIFMQIGLVKSEFKVYSIVGFILSQTSSTIIFICFIALHVAKKLIFEIDYLIRIFAVLVWIFDACDVVFWDLRCLSIFGIAFTWILTFSEDSSTKKSKYYIFPFLAGLSLISSISCFTLFRFDFLETRQDRVLSILNKNDTEISLSWSPYQATGDFGFVLSVFLLFDSFHIILRKGLIQSLHFQGPIYVRVIPFHLIHGSAFAIKIPSDHHLQTNNNTGANTNMFSVENTKMENTIDDENSTDNNAVTPDDERDKHKKYNEGDGEVKHVSFENNDPLSVSATPPKQLVTNFEEQSINEEAKTTSQYVIDTAATTAAKSRRLTFSDVRGVSKLKIVNGQFQDTSVKTSSKLSPSLKMNFRKNLRPFSAAEETKRSKHESLRLENSPVIPVNTVVLKEADCLAFHFLGLILGSSYLSFMGRPTVRILAVWLQLIPLGIWVICVLPGFIPNEYSYLTLLVFLPSVRSISLKSRNMLKLILKTRGFWLKIMFVTICVGFFAHMLFWDERIVGLFAFLILSFDFQSNDARCVFFVSSSKNQQRILDDNLKRQLTKQQNGGNYSKKCFQFCFIFTNLAFALILIALPLQLNLGLIRNAQINAAIQLLPIENFTQSGGGEEEQQPRGFFAKITLFQFVSDFLNGIVILYLFYVLLDLRLSLSNKARRIRLKNFHALVRPIFVTNYEQDDDEENEEDDIGNIENLHRIGDQEVERTFMM